MLSLLLFFFFQAEDGIRDIGVTGVQPVCSSDLGWPAPTPAPSPQRACWRPLGGLAVPAAAGEGRAREGPERRGGGGWEWERGGWGERGEMRGCRHIKKKKKVKSARKMYRTTQSD